LARVVKHLVGKTVSSVSDTVTRRTKH